MRVVFRIVRGEYIKWIVKYKSRKEKNGLEKVTLTHFGDSTDNLEGGAYYRLFCFYGFTASRGRFIDFNYFTVHVFSKRKGNKTYEIVDMYSIQEGTPIYYKDYRHVKVYLSRFNTEKAINRYMTQEGLYFETVARSMLDKELTVLDKSVFVLVIEDTEANKLTISYDMERVSQGYLETLMQLSIGETVQLKDLTQEVSLDIPSYAYVLVNEK
ncbi:hypothetical protein HB912_00740 [Listeria aquatica]|uniref:Uncharacterized protein n=1 Tax=Listeria aquatica TaxID=1494960 RepID=A0A841ZME0_9LIST|nr:hypothetical protein [Listeria aquatica]MBC1520170.1 hypothetical protein [Listeria aquatica]